MTDTQNIPLNKLVPWDGNVRKTSPRTGLEELESSIAAHGLLQSLVVRKKGKAKFAVIAGNRRLQALQRLAANDKITPDYLVSCRVIEKGTDPTEISLTENTIREQMHPADEFEAFRELVDNGIPAADVAARFGVTESVVLKRLKLARVSPVILAAYREDELTLAQVMAFAVTDDHAAQEQALDNLSPYNRDPDEIRDALTENDIPATDRRVRFVTLAGYEEAGGTVRRDLFVTDENGTFILNPDLLNRLAGEKLLSLAEEVRAEGWKWVEIRPCYDYGEWSDCTRAHETLVPLTPEQQAEYDALESELDSFYDIEGELTEEQEARADTIRERIDELDDREPFWASETLAIAGAVVTLDHDGEPDIRRGHILPEDKPKRTTKVPEANSATISARPLYSAALTEYLTAHRSAALAATLAKEPEIAFAATVHAMALGLFYPSADTRTCLKMFASEQSFRKTDDTPANRELMHRKALWQSSLPEDSKDLWQWCLKQRTDTLMELLSLCAAFSVNAVQAKADRPDGGRLRHALDLSEAVTLDMNHWFTPSAENYYSRISKTQILEAIEEATGKGIAPAVIKRKKGEIATFAEQVIAGTGWLPAILRSPEQPSELESDATTPKTGEGA